MDNADIMYGKHFESMYERSMVGIGAVKFAVWGYVIAKQKPDKKVGSQVALNPALLAAIIGESEADVAEAIEFFCSPDEKSTTKAEGGRRLVKIGEFDYRVVNGAKYRAIRDEESRRQQNRDAQRRHREKQGKAMAGEKLFIEAQERGDERGADQILDEVNANAEARAARESDGGLHD